HTFLSAPNKHNLVLDELLACTAKSDSVCEPMDGFHCIDFTEGSCAAAEKHNSNCQPGYYISHQGRISNPGNRVISDCSESSSTSCLPCVRGTFLPNPSGLKVCFICKTCDPGSGLRTKRACTAKSDSVCEPMDGFHCIDFTEGSCAAAEKHNSNCQPGYYISHQGNTFTDTECSPCRNGTYSDGSFMSCLPHTKCEDMDLLLVKPGNASADSECIEPTTNLIITTVVVFSMIVLLLGATLIYYVLRPDICFCIRTCAVGTAST
uniref:TNFR-Cys domain-containing protein n=1 Tax=Gouania willdenowi TaxID=441366 RepID=A0A8C5EB24_GOUWI